MGRLTVTKEIVWDCAHQLVHHTGLCKNVHGHTYKLQATFIGELQEGTHSSEGMIEDFGIIKKVLKEKIADRFDHAWVAKGDEPILPFLKQYNYKVLELGVRTTAEKMAEWIYYELKDQIPTAQIYKVRLYETATSYAEYTEA